MVLRKNSSPFPEHEKNHSACKSFCLSWWIGKTLLPAVFVLMVSSVLSVSADTVLGADNIYLSAKNATVSGSVNEGTLAYHPGYSTPGANTTAPSFDIDFRWSGLTLDAVGTGDDYIDFTLRVVPDPAVDVYWSGTGFNPGGGFGSGKSLVFSITNVVLSAGTTGTVSFAGFTSGTIIGTDWSAPYLIDCGLDVNGHALHTGTYTGSSTKRVSLANNSFLDQTLVVDNAVVTAGSALLRAMDFQFTYTGPPPEPVEGPDILWIITDDHRADSLGCFNLATRGTKESRLGFVSSPNLDALADEGFLFTQAYCNSPACAPSRASMHTGRYVHHNGIVGFELAHDRPTMYRPTIPQVLGTNGYNTALFGKQGVRINAWNNGPSWTSLNMYQVEVGLNDLEDAGLTDYYHDTIYEGGSNVGTRCYWFYPDGTSTNYTRERTDGQAIPPAEVALKAQVEAEQDVLRSYLRDNPTLIIGGVSTMPAEQTLDGHIVDEFKTYLQNRGQPYTTGTGDTVNGPEEHKPVFINLGFHLPHTSVLPSPEFRALFTNQTYAIPEFDPAELDMLPPQLVTLYNKSRVYGMPTNEIHQAIQDYYAFCAMGDHLIGDAIDAFKAYNAQTGREYLIIFVCGDHGWHLHENGIEAKFGPYGTANRGAVILAGSDGLMIPTNQVSHGFVEYVDFAPTIFAAAGIDPADWHDGENLLEHTAGTNTPREYVLGEFNNYYGPRAFMRGKDFAFSMRHREKDGKPGTSNSWRPAPGEDLEWGLTAPRADVEMALFDLRIDPLERWNVADHPPYTELADWFRTKLGTIVLGDRIEVDWAQTNTWYQSTFGVGADDKRLDIPEHLIPSPQLPGDLIIDPETAPGSVPLSYKFSTLSGSNYVIETSDTLTNTTWSAFESFSGDGGMKSFMLPNTHTSLFVRVRLVE